MNANTQESLIKLPEVTLIFWIIKIAATTLGETGGDAVSMSMNLGYLVGTGIFAAIFAVTVIAQISAKQFHPLLYWTTIIATTTVGTTLADFADRSLGIGYSGGTALLFTLLLGSLFIWHRSLGLATSERAVRGRPSAAGGTGTGRVDQVHQHQGRGQPGHRQAGALHAQQQKSFGESRQREQGRTAPVAKGERGTAAAAGAASSCSWRLGVRENQLDEFIVSAAEMMPARQRGRVDVPGGGIPSAGLPVIRVRHENAAAAGRRQC